MSSSPFNVDVIHSGAPATPRFGPDHHTHVVSVKVVGELDLVTAASLTDCLVQAARDHGRVSWSAAPAGIELNLSGLTLMTTAGITAIADSRAALLTVGCQLCLCFPQVQVLRLVDLAVRGGWLSPDVECTAYHPWPAVAQPIPTSSRDLTTPATWR